MLINVKDRFYIYILICLFILVKVAGAENLLSGLIVAESRNGVVVLDAGKNPATVKAGIRGNDVILKINGDKIKTGADYLRKSDSISDRDKAVILIKRDGYAFDVTVHPSNTSKEKKVEIVSAVVADEARPAQTVAKKIEVVAPTTVVVDETQPTQIVAAKNEAEAPPALVGGEAQPAQISSEKSSNKSSIDDPPTPEPTSNETLDEAVVNLVDAVDAIKSSETETAGKHPEDERRKISLDLDAGDGPAINKTVISEADTFCKDGLIFFEEGLKEEALDNFRIAADLYNKTLREQKLSKEELVAIRKNLKMVNTQLNPTLVDAKTVGNEEAKAGKNEDLKKSAESKETAVAEKIGGKSSIVAPALKSGETISKAGQKQETKPFGSGKLSFNAAIAGEFWKIESTTILLKKPEVPSSPAKLIGNLVGGLKPGTIVKVLETKISGVRWARVGVYNKNNEVYAKGWIQSDMVGKASKTEKR